MGGDAKGGGKAGAPTGSGAQPAGGAPTGKADQYVPVFDNSQRSYKEFRKRCELYRVKMELAGRKQETIFNIVTLLTGKAWDMIDDLSTETLQSEGGYNAVFERLDRGFKYEPLTELPEDFETFFVKLSRKPSQTLQEYAAEFSRAERQLRVTHSVTLPEKVLSWWYLRRSGIGREQRQLVLTNVGADNLSLENVQKAMNFILGQDSRLEPRWGKSKTDVFYHDELPADEYDPTSDDWEQVYWQDDDGSGAPWPDQDEDYYDNDAAPAEEDIFDVDEFDNVFASYTDAKAKLNNMRVSRGFYPVVALVDRGNNQGPRPGGAGKGRGKGKRDKGRGKGDAGKQGPVTPKGSTAKARGRQAMGRQICLRCGQAGHWARNCPQASNGDKKRRMGEADDEVMMVAETYALNDDDMEEEACNRAVQDGGAASVLGSAIAVRSYLRYLLERGVDITAIPCFTCTKNFRFGNSATGGSAQCLLLPMVLEGRKLQIMTYVIEGNAPLLFGRPLLKKLGVTVDYENEVMKIKDGPWQAIPLGPRGEHQLVLTENVARLLDDTPFDEILAPDDYEAHVNVQTPVPIEAILHLTDTTAADGEANLVKHNSDDDLERPARQIEPKDDDATMSPASAQDSNTPAPPGGATTEKEMPNTDVNHATTEKEATTLKGNQVKTLSKGRLRGLIMSAQAAAKKHKNLLSQANKIGNAGKRVVWEVFTGKGQLSREITDQGGDAQNFCKATGWNFSQPKVRKRFLQKLQEEQPDEVMIAPSCRIWSFLMDRTVASDPGRGPELRRRRQDHHDNILVFAAVIFETQRRAGRHAHIEQPWSSRSWLTKALARLQGHCGYVDQCEYGLTLPDNKNDPKPMKKATCFFSTKKTFAYRLEKRCQGDHEHGEDDGTMAETTGDYPPELAKKLADLLLENQTDDVQAVSANPEGEPVLQDLENEPADNTEDVSRKNRDLRAKVGSQAMNYVTRLHKNLGHPSSEVLVRMLEEVQATTNVIEAAKGYVCPTCYSRRRPPGVPPAAGLMARNFGDRLLADSAWIDLEGGRRCVLTVMDQATRFVAVRLLESERATELIKGVERSWIKQFGVPKMLRIDEAKGWSAKHFENGAR